MSTTEPVRISLNADHRNFYVTVPDTGIGIDEERSEYIFERFYRVKSHSTEVEGTDSDSRSRGT